MRILLALSLALAPLPALADPLRELEPLMEVFAASHDSPGWDVAGIRCAGLLYAQDYWHEDHGGSGPSQRLLSEAATGLDQAVQHRVGLGQDLTKATLSVEADLHRVFKLYVDRFTENAKAGQPWSRDALIKGDLGYCKIALG